MKTCKRFLSVLLAVLMLVCAVPVMNVAASTSTPYYNWKQYDSQWGENYIGDKTIKAVGCAATSVAMLIVQAGFRNESNIDPGTFVSEMKAIGGFTNNSIYWGKVSQLSGCSGFTYVGSYTLSGSESQKIAQIKEKTDAGYSVVVSVKDNGHYVAVQSASSNSVTMMDPGSVYTNLYSKYSASNSKRMLVYQGHGTNVGQNPTGNVAPTWATLSIDKDNVRLAENFTFAMVADSPVNYFWLTICRASNNEVILSESTNGSFTTSFLSCDHYYAWCSAANSKGSVDSNRVDFYVYGDPPTSGGITANQTEITLGESVTFTIWSNAYYTRNFVSFFDESGNKVIDGWQEESFVFTPTSAGNYSGYATLYTVDGSFDTQWISVHVKNTHQDLGNDFYANIIKCEGWSTVGVADNDNVQIIPAKAEAPEFWHFLKDNDGAYAIYNCSNDKVLTVNGMGVENGDSVYVSSDTGADNQRWYISGKWNGEYCIIPKSAEKNNTDKVMDVFNNLTDAGTNIHVWGKNGSTAQQFSIYGQPKADASTLSVTTANGRADFSWTEASNADSYNIRIKNTVTGDTVDIYKETGSSKTVYLESGQYVAYIDSCNVYSFTKSNEVSFTIVHTHSYNSAVTTPATCSSTGIRTYTCTCGDSYTETIGKNSNNHINTTNVGATDSSCTVKGYSAGVYCNDCKQYISGHDEQPLAAHQTTVINAREATYDADGYTGDTYCTVCKQTLSYGSVIPKLTKPEEPTNPTQPTSQQQQQQSGSCKYCGQNHTGFPGVLIGFFHSILALFGLKKK